MPYAAHREHPGSARARHAVPFHVLDAIVSWRDHLLHHRVYPMR